MQSGKHKLPLAQHRGALIRSVTAVIDDACSSSTSNPCSPSRRLTIDTGKRKPSPAERTETLCNELLACLRSQEWRAMRSTNLGVLSGTGVIEDLLMRRLQTQVAALHVLVLKHTSAGNQLSALGTRLTQREMQQMQVLMDACGFPELSDYLRVLRYNTMDPSATSEVGAPINWGARRAKSVPRNRMSHSQEGRPRSLRHRAYDADTLRFADVVGPLHRLADAAARLLDERRAAAAATAALEAAARARETLTPRTRTPPDDGLGWWRRQQEFLNRKLALLTRHDEPPQPDYATVDVEAHWRDTVYQSQASSPKRWNLGSLDHAVLIAEAVPLHGAAGGLRRTPATYTGMTVARNVGTADPAFTARSAQTTRSHVTINERPPAIEPSMAGSSISISLHSLPSTTGIGVGNTTSNTGISSGGVNVSSSGGVANGGVAMAGSQNHRLAAASGPGAGAVSAGAG